MLIRDLHIRGFGKFNNYKINFGEGLNIVYGDNEAGKSTVHQFIQGMLFGFFKPYIKTKKYTEVYDKYLPWNMKEGYEGTLIFEENNKAYRIERNFMKRHDSFKLYNEITGEDITKQLPYNPVTKLPDIYGLIGLSETAFKNIISISQLQSQ
ncbi:MAG: ATP-binding protein, partial [Eubacteriales bacterium]